MLRFQFDKTFYELPNHKGYQIFNINLVRNPVSQMLYAMPFGVTELSSTEKRLYLHRPHTRKFVSQNTFCKVSWPVNQKCRAKHAIAKTVGQWWK